jgi:hypothetical protein
MRSIRIRALCVLGTSLLSFALADAATPRSQADDDAAEAKETSSKTPAKRGERKDKLPDWDKVVEGAKRLDGLFALYYNEKQQKLFMEIKDDQYDKDVILPMAIARGAGLMYLGGETLNFGDQWLISFRRAGDRLLVVRRNVRFQAEAGSPQADAVKVSYNDSVIKALPIKSEKNDGGLVLIDLADLFMTDLPGIGIQPDVARSTWAKVKVFPKNVEIEASVVFSAERNGFLSFFGDDAIADPRGAQVVIHYGMSMLPATSYRTRLADDRVGHFLSVVKDFSQDVNESPDVRYVTRWNLEKEKPDEEKSPPKQPIIFWIERTVPREYRRYVREGILEWNKAFEKIGFIDAIQVRDQQGDDDFDPEDIRYNTFRWITTSAGFAVGPSRTNPKTGEILDADIIFDEGMIRYWRQEYVEATGIPAGMAMLLAGQRQAFFRMYASELPFLEDAEPTAGRLLAANRDMLLEQSGRPRRAGALSTPLALGRARCQMGPGMQRQLAMLAAVLAAQGDLTPGGKVPEKFIGQAVKEVVMHEVGHTLGLRHNFKASSALSLKEVNDPEVTAKKGLSGSVMDYLPANIVARGEKQGDYFSPTIGAYDYWAIEYAYKPIESKDPKVEKAELAKIADKAAQPELTYGTDEDMYSNPDPRINAFDLGDPLEFAESRVKLVRASLDQLQDRVVEKGEGWQRARSAFSVLLGELSRATVLATQYVGGEYTARDHRGDPNGRPPMKPIEIAKQREALRLLKDEILSAKAFQFKPELLRHLAPEHWFDERAGLFGSGGYQYPLLSRAAGIQRIVLSRLLDPQTLRALQEIELHAEPGQETLELPEVFNALTDSIWSELPDGAEPAKGQAITISALRRTLQREHVTRLARLVLGPKPLSGSSFIELIFDGDLYTPAPADARALARRHLRQIDARIAKITEAKDPKIDAMSLAHLKELHEKILKVFSATLELNEP